MQHAQFPCTAKVILRERHTDVFIASETAVVAGLDEIRELAQQLYRGFLGNAEYYTEDGDVKAWYELIAEPVEQAPPVAGTSWRVSDKAIRYARQYGGQEITLSVQEGDDASDPVEFVRRVLDMRGLVLLAAHPDPTDIRHRVIAVVGNDQDPVAASRYQAGGNSWVPQPIWAEKTAGGRRIKAK